MGEFAPFRGWLTHNNLNIQDIQATDSSTILEQFELSLKGKIIISALERLQQLSAPQIAPKSVKYIAFILGN